jgi:hypothetical protein
MSPRRNLSDDFEEVYLRYNMVQKYMPQADCDLLSDPQFNRVVSYMTNRYFSIYRDLFSTYGFEFDDLRSIVSVFGLTYWGHVKPPARNKDSFTIMMRYIGQRMQNLVKWVARKFGVDEAMVFTMDKFDKVAEMSAYTEYSDPKEDSEEEVVVYKTKHKDKMLVAMREKIAKEPSLYAEQLCHYATTKHVARDVRKKARDLCKRYGIDYLAWLRDKSKNLNFDPIHYTF